MADSLGVKIGLEGEVEFKNSLREINQSFKVLGSEMTLVASEFEKNDKSIQAVTARNQVLNKEIDLQKDKISTLESALNNATESFGENDRRTQNWAVQLNNAKAELNGMERELGSNNKALRDASSGMSDAEREAAGLGKSLDGAGKEIKSTGKETDGLEKSLGEAGKELKDTGKETDNLGREMDSTGK